MSQAAGGRSSVNGRAINRGVLQEILWSDTILDSKISPWPLFRRDARFTGLSSNESMNCFRYRFLGTTPAMIRARNKKGKSGEPAI